MARVGPAALGAASILLIVGLLPVSRQPPGSVAIAASGRVLAPIGRQVGWLDLEAPRRQILTSLADPAYVSDVADTPTAPFAVVAVSTPFDQHGPAGNDLARLDTSSGALSPLLQRASDQESFVAPAWWADGSGLLVEHDDLSSPLAAYPGESTPRYASRIDAVAPDGWVTPAVVPSGRMPSPAPDGGSAAIVQTTEQGTGLVLWSQSDGSTAALIPFGQFADVA